MITLNQLIKELCPDGVEYKLLSDVSHYSSERIDAKVINSHNYIGVDNLLQDKKGKIDSSYVPKDGRLTKFSDGDILIGNIRPYLKKIWLATDDGGTNGDVLVIQINDRKILSSDQFFMYNMQNAKGAKMPRGDKSAVMKYVIPLPPLPVQREIVRILNNLSELTANLTTELTAELTAREKQYEYYRKYLLSFGEEVEWMTLDYVCENISSGNNKSRNSSGEYPVYGSTGIIAYSDFYKYSENLLLVARVGANAGFVHRAKGQYDVSDNTLILKPKEGYDLSFAFYQLTNLNLNDLAVGAGQPLITAGKLKQIELPIPPLEEQKRIVSILDQFDALYKDLTCGLPAEIEARRKQFEYYRDKLLTFQEV